MDERGNRARAAGFNEWLKLEVIGDQETLLPDTQATLEAAKTLVDEGFKIMAYTNDDVVTALRLEDAGCVSVMPLASPIGSGLGVVNPYFIREIKRRCDGRDWATVRSGSILTPSCSE